MPLGGVLCLCLALQAGAAAGVPAVRKIALFRAQAGLPPLSASAQTRLASASPATLTAAQREAAHALLARVSPWIQNQDSRFDTPEIAALRSSIREAKDTLKALADVHIRKGEVDQAAIEPLYAGARRSAGLPDYLAEIVADGAPQEARARLFHLSLPRKEKKGLAPLIEDKPPLPAVAALKRQEEKAKREFQRGAFAEAYRSAKTLLSLIQNSGLRRSTEQFFGVTALELLDRIKLAASWRIHGSKPLKTGESVRIQKYADCAVHQLYNHPALAAVRRLLPYPRFLVAVERFLNKPARRNGLDDFDIFSVVRALGHDHKRVYPKSAEDLARMLREHGALLATIRWFSEKGVTHAVLVRELAEDGSFVTIDPHFEDPNGYDHDDLTLMHAKDFAYLSPKPGEDPEAAAAAFARDYGAPQTWREWLRSLLRLPPRPT